MNDAELALECAAEAACLASSPLTDVRRWDGDGRVRAKWRGVVAAAFAGGDWAEVRREHPAKLSRNCREAEPVQDPDLRAAHDAAAAALGEGCG